MAIGKIKVGLVGTGDIGRLHARALQTLEDVELCVCVGIKPKGAEAFARDFGAKVYPSYYEMLSDPSVHAIDICVPNDLHRQYVEEVAEAGKHIFCEKPIALSLEDAEVMQDAADKTKVLLMISQPLRFWPEYVKAREVIRSDQLGACQAITMRRMLSLLISVRGEQDWRHKPERMGGAIVDLQIHDIDFLNWTFGLPEHVYCSAIRSEDGGLNHTYAIFNYASGMMAMVESSFMLQGDPMVFTMKAICEEGTLDYGLDLEYFNMHSMVGPKAAGSGSRSNRAKPERNNPATLICYRANKEPEVLVQQEYNVLDAVFTRELSYFVDCAKGKIENTICPVEDAIDALKIALASLKSAQSGEQVRISQA